MSEYINNRAHRIGQMKEIIKGLHEGAPVEEAKAKMAELVQQTDATEIAAMEQELLSEGIPLTQVQSMCDIHSQVVRDILAHVTGHEIAPGHPVDTFQRENEALQKAAVELRGAVPEIVSGDEAKAGEAILRARAAINDLLEVDKHYQRKENLLFPYLERYGITGPSKVMWAKDDEARAALKNLEGLLRAAAQDRLQRANIPFAAQAALMHLEEMVQKEERILFPLSLETLTEDDWGQIWAQSSEYGWSLVEPRQGYRPPEVKDAPPEAVVSEKHSLAFPTGSLTFEQLKGIFAALPIDITFVDADDRVRYFSHGEERIFGRSTAILGRKVQNCHPPKSVNVVEQIVEDFRSGKQDTAEFWINFQGKFVHIRYFAVRDEQGKYLGTLEMTQDLSPLRALDGERRLLQYDSPSAQN